MYRGDITRRSPVATTNVVMVMNDEDQTRDESIMSDRRVASGFRFRV